MLSVHVGVAQGACHRVGLALGHLEEGKVLHQVDAPHLDALVAHVAVHQVDDLRGIESVALAAVHEEAHITLLCLAGAIALFTALAWPVLAFCPLSVVFCPLTSFNDRLRFGGIAVVFHEPAKLTGHHAAYDVFFIQPVELAVYGGEELGYLGFIDLGLLDVVNHLPQLLFANLLACGQGSLDKLLADDLFYFAHAAALA